jgi:prepilin-type N-terminal cleavage/methylation domain-containing protein
VRRKVRISSVPVQRRSGFTLIEVVVAAVVMASISLVSSALLVGVLKTREAVMAQHRLDRMAAIALLRIEENVRESTAIYIPNAHDTTRPVLAIAFRFDDDGDGLFDEDAAGAGDAFHGVTGFDDDGDGAVDEGAAGDDDEDGLVDEDPLDGTDNDGDGLIDEDFGPDMDGSGGDDDDGDGSTNEDGADAIVYYLDGTDLMEWHPIQGTNIVSRDVSGFRVTFEPALSSLGSPAVTIEIDFVAVGGDVRSYRTRAMPRNLRLFGL